MKFKITLLFVCLAALAPSSSFAADKSLQAATRSDGPMVCNSSGSCFASPVLSPEEEMMRLEAQQILNDEILNLLSEQSNGDAPVRQKPCKLYIPKYCPPCKQVTPGVRDLCEVVPVQPGERPMCGGEPIPIFPAVTTGDGDDCVIIAENPDEINAWYERLRKLAEELKKLLERLRDLWKDIVMS